MVNWDDATDKQLLLNLLDVCGAKLTTAHYKEAAQRMEPSSPPRESRE